MSLPPHFHICPKWSPIPSISIYMLISPNSLFPVQSSLQTCVIFLPSITLQFRLNKSKMNTPPYWNYFFWVPILVNDDTMYPKAQARNTGYILRLKLFLNFSQICLLCSRPTEKFLTMSLVPTATIYVCTAFTTSNLQSFKSLSRLQPVIFLIHQTDHINFLLKS